MNDNDDIHTYINTYSLSFSSSSSSSSSRLFIDSVLIVFFRDTSCRLDNRYFGHNSHLLLLYKRKKKKEKHMYRCVKICFTSAVLLADCIDFNKHRTLYSPLTFSECDGVTAGRSTTNGMRWNQISLDNTIRRVFAKWTRLSALACVRGVHATSII